MHKPHIPNIAARTKQYFDEFATLLDTLDPMALQRVVAYLDEARSAGRTIFLAGNGGSASTASHWANDLGKNTRSSTELPIRVVSLSDNVSWFTALANDEGYSRVFSGQLENFAQPGDVLVVISASGNSPNLIDAVSVARQHGVTTVGLLGFDGGMLRTLVDECLWFRSDKGAYGPVENAHLTVCHLIVDCLKAVSHSRAGVDAVSA